MIFKFRFLEQGAHTHIRLFAGVSEGALGKCGDLVMRNEEWSAFQDSFAEFSPIATVKFENEEDDHSTLIPR